ncbi:FecCD family ABC transporter permease [Paractinoplanes toevensis]|uniref:Iron-enterobactin transporter permease n=1 Tax=Paractinoplanes toevensis TaxID=571911 RepID=A0A919T620_9ACTN|nr:iron chelate uptake ABC transporter family permease subunit [Actinoplanes toevensis]GIM89037.1 iron-enterobactin transporter permease [Actinoplanes toevensis]
MSLDFGRRTIVLRPVTRVPVRPLVVCGGLVLAALATAVLALGTGEVDIPPAAVLRALAGSGSGADHLVVVEWRLPRVLLALILGAALGLAGAIFQALTRNPLGSPDVIGFNTGSFTGVLVATATVGTGYYVTVAGALAGGLLTAAAVYLFAYRRGVQGFRLIIVGIAVGAVLTSVNEWFIMRADLTVALAASIWGQGTLNNAAWRGVGPAAIVLGVLAVVLLAMGPRLSLLEMGEDAAAALGVRVERARLAYLVIGVALTAAVAAAAGPISFVSLAAPQLARRLTGTPGVALVPAAAMGALLLIVSDWLALHAFAPTQLPVGVLTVAVGGVYFVGLLLRQGRKQ